MNTKNIINQIKSGKNLEIHLPQYASELMTTYYNYSLIRLAMNYYTFYEVVSDPNNQETEDVLKQMKEVDEIIHATLLSEFDGMVSEESIKRLDGIRNIIIKKMKVLTAYTDILQIYEHVLNRIEYKFEENLAPINDEASAGEIIQYIFNTNDNVIVNGKIQEVIGQLPVRMTKTRYFELVRDSLSIYKGAEKASIDNYIYMLRTCAMLYNPEGIEEYYVELHDFVEELSQVSFKDINHEEYKSYSRRLREKAEYIGNIVDAYVLMQDVVNNLYTSILSIPYMVGDIEDDKICNEILKLVNDKLRNNIYEDISENIYNQLEQVEGRQEKLFHVYTTYETILDEVKEKNKNLIDSLMLGKLFECLNIVQKLLSSSIFIELEDIEVNEIADDAYIEMVTKDLINELSELFSRSNQGITRAVISNTISRMPVFFNSTKEVTDYVQVSLMQCKDLAEKTASLQVIKDMMAD